MPAANPTFSPNGSGSENRGKTALAAFEGSARRRDSPSSAEEPLSPADEIGVAGVFVKDNVRATRAAPCKQCKLNLHVSFQAV
jgi:hypothetical protein